MEAFGLLIVLILIALYFLPTIVAAAGSKRKTGAIFVLNLLLGWTLLGWVGALVWAVADERSDASRYPQPAYPATPQPPSTAATLHSGPSAVDRDQPAWRALPTPGQRVHLMANRIMRGEPDLTAMSTGEFRAGTDVTILTTSSGWVRAQSDDGKEGWIQL
jgi:T4 superinfection immunity protein/SH3 domain-containing protein